jgi:8-oxo-dGTP pyrophosphatase MutT (NUDIX family)
MLIFTNNVAVHITEKPNPGKIPDYNIDFIVDLFNPETLSGNVFIKNAGFKDILNILSLIQNSKFENLKALFIIVKDEFEFKNRIKGKIGVIKAAGGLVTNSKDQILMMKRLGFWDLPKGKADQGEKSKATAQREVEEECNIEVKVEDRICTTWHTYILKGKLVIKRTKWYKMTLISDKKMKPQFEEGIEELRWCTLEECQENLKNSYKSINFVFKSHLIY